MGAHVRFESVMATSRRSFNVAFVDRVISSHHTSRETHNTCPRWRCSSCYCTVRVRTVHASLAFRLSAVLS